MGGHAAHMWMCGAMVIVALGVVLFTGNVLAFLPIIGCVLMMVLMMWMMGGISSTDWWFMRMMPGTSVRTQPSRT